MDHPTIMKLVIGWTLIGAFAFTVVATLLGMIGWVKFENPKQHNKLFSVLIVQLVVGCLGVFFGFLEFNPDEAVSKIQVAALNDPSQIFKITSDNDEDKILRLLDDAWIRT